LLGVMPGLPATIRRRGRVQFARLRGVAGKEQAPSPGVVQLNVDLKSSK
jgi:hypothetical protein